MNEQEFRGLLADYLAGELDEAQAAAFRAELEASEQRRKLATELQAAAAALEANVLSHEQAEQRTASLELEGATARARSASERSARGGGRRHQRLRVALRYAAVIVLAFGAGFLARGWQLSGRDATPVPTLASMPVNARYVANFVQATQSLPQASAFSHSLLTLARR